MATHTLVYFGWYGHGFRRFHAGQTGYWKKGDSSDSPPPNEVDFPPASFDGIRFGYFQASGGDLAEYLLVSADDVVLSQPVLLQSDRHGVSAPGPQFPKLTDDTAAAILVDMIVANPAFRDALGRKLRGLT